MMDLRCTFLVVTSGKPSLRSKRIWWPNTLRVPVPVRSVLATPVLYTWRMKSSYWVRTGRWTAGELMALDYPRITRFGFIRLCGSSACLMLRIRPSATGDLWCSSFSAFRLPMPCSAEIEPW